MEQKCGSFSWRGRSLPNVGLRINIIIQLPEKAAPMLNVGFFMKTHAPEVIGITCVQFFRSY